MKYLLTLYGDESQESDPESPEFEVMIEEYRKFGADLEAADKFLGGEALVPASMATTVRIRNDETLVTDGPFAETKEQLGGFYLIESDDLDEALAWAARGEGRVGRGPSDRRVRVSLRGAWPAEPAQ